MELHRAAAAISPFNLITHIDTPSRGNAALGVESGVRSPNAITRQLLEMQLLAVAEKMYDLQDRERLLVGGSRNGSGLPRMWRLMSVRSASTRPPPDVEAQLQTAREQTNMLVARINALEANSDSAWGRVIGDEPPPEYN
jgi:hypothetical protein